MFNCLIIDRSANDCSAEKAQNIDSEVFLFLTRSNQKVTSMLTRPLPNAAQAASRKKKKTCACLRLPLSVAIACIYPSVAYSLPQNPDVAAGSVSMSTSDRTMQINQTSNKAIINWKRFGIGPNESVIFNQPSRTSVVLNRVSGAESSVLDGALSANGQVFLINPNGVLISPTAHINVSGLLASTLDLENHQFLDNNYLFNGKSTSEAAAVINDGAINAVDGGYVVMLSGKVRNNGVIDAPSGHVLMGAGSQATLYINDSSLLGYRIDAGSAAALVENVNRINADGGQVSLAARGLTGASQLASAAVNNSGIIEARTLDGKPGAISLTADMQNGRVYLNGTLDASASSGKGGTVDTAAFAVSVDSNAQVSTDSLSGIAGLWTITSGNPVIGANLNDVSNTALSNALDRSNVTVVANGQGVDNNGNLSVQREIASQSSNRLVLKSANNLLINAPVSMGSGGFLAHADTTGTGVGKLIIAAEASVRASEGAPIDIYTNVPDYKDTTVYDGFISSPYRLWMLVNNVHQLQGMESNLSGRYALGRDIDAAETASWNGGAGFTPLGLGSRRFDGQLDGMN
ncbi:MAG: filamentous hemagglutinin N-terminal domain-containing protein, partial [Proteobacteria bacterium]